MRRQQQQTARRTDSERDAVEKCSELVCGQIAKLTGADADEVDRTEPRAGQAAHGVTDVIEQPSHDAIAALVDDQLDDGAVGVLTDDLAFR